MIDRFATPNPSNLEEINSGINFLNLLIKYLDKSKKPDIIKLGIENIYVTIKKIDLQQIIS
jgi:hypothetical protein